MNGRGPTDALFLERVDDTLGKLHVLKGGDGRRHVLAIDLNAGRLAHLVVALFRQVENAAWHAPRRLDRIEVLDAFGQLVEAEKRFALGQTGQYLLLLLELLLAVALFGRRRLLLQLVVLIEQADGGLGSERIVLGGRSCARLAARVGRVARIAVIALNRLLVLLLLVRLRVLFDLYRTIYY